MDFKQIEALWTKNGGDPAWAPLMAGIAIAESGGNTQALNNNPSTGDYSVGLWQINYFQALAPGRTKAYGSPAALQADPNLQAKAAIDLFGSNAAGIGNWTNDPTWNAWVKAGRPQKPSAAMVQSWLGGKTGTPGPSAPGSDGGTAGTGASSVKGVTCDTQGGGINILFGHIGTACQMKALTGGLLIGVGGFILLAGTVVIAAYGLSSTKVGRAATQVASRGGPIGKTVGAVGKVSRAPANRRQANQDAQDEALAAVRGPQNAAFAQRTRDEGFGQSVDSGARPARVPKAGQRGTPFNAQRAA